MKIRFAQLGLFALFSIASLIQAAEIPPAPFEPVDWSPVYTTADLQGPRIGLPADQNLPDDPFFPKQYQLANFGQPDAKGRPGIPGCDSRILEALKSYQPQQEAVLAILDSGLDLTHEDVDPSCLWTNPGESGPDAQGHDKATNAVDDDQNGYIDDVHGWNFVNNTPTLQEDQYHGTHVGGLLCARVNNAVGITGAYPGLKIMLVKVFGLGATLGSDKFAEAIRYAVNNGAKVLSNSYGTPSYSDIMRSGVQYCHDKGALFVCASGNSRKNMDSEEDKDYPSCYGFSSQLVVGATDNRDLSTFSNFGSMVELAAPGENIFSLFPKSTYRSLSGTSQACPLAAAAASLVWAMHPEFTATQVKARLLESADQIPGLSLYIKGGLRLNVDNALKGIKGNRLPIENFPTWKQEERVIESLHPYQNEATPTWDISQPGATKMRFHVTRLGVEHYNDTLTLEDPTGKPLQFFNGEREDFWTDPVATDSVRLVLSASEFSNGYGFRIDKIQFIP